MSTHWFQGRQGVSVSMDQLAARFHGLRDYGAAAAATCKSGDGGEEMDEKNHEIAHIRIAARNWKLAEFRAN